MWKTFAYFISLLMFFIFRSIPATGQDTIPIPLKIKAGFEVSGPVIYYTNKDIRNNEAFVTVDLDEKKSLYLSAGTLDYKFSQYNYTYHSKGSYMRIGMDFNILKPEKSTGKYWAGLGFHYGISRFSSEYPYLKKTDLWGTTTSSVPSKTYWGHFIEADPGVRAEIFNHISIGWSISIRMLLHTTTGNDLKSINMPGFGNTTKTFTTGLNYFISWTIPFKKINVIRQPESTDDDEDVPDNDQNTNTNTNSSPGNSGNITPEKSRLQ